jgi:hypothetical protein
MSEFSSVIMISMFCGGNRSMCGSCVAVNACISLGAVEKSNVVLGRCLSLIGGFFVVADFLLADCVFLAEDVGFFFAVVGFFLVTVFFFAINYSLI